MTGPTLILPLASGVYLAKNERGLSAEGPTPEAALAGLKAVTERWLAEYHKTLSPPAAAPPRWAGWTGTLDKDDPMWEEWAAAVAEYRAARDAAP